MEKEYFIELLQKYLRGNSTAEEDHLLFTYYDLFQAEPDVLRLMSQEKKNRLKDQMFAGILENIQSVDRRSGKVRSMKRWAAVAAIFLLAAGACVGYLFKKPAITSRLVAARHVVKKQNHLFHLADGSLIILSSGSTLKMAPSFAHGATRDVYLEGEAFFDIKHDASRPFIVHSNEIITTVLGTAFNIRALKGDSHIMVTVSRGKVRVSEKERMLDLLTPDEQIVYNKPAATAVKNYVKASDFMQWRDKEDLLLDNVTFGEAASLLELRYGVSVTFRDQALEKARFTTVLLKNEKFEQVIKTICEFNAATMEFTNNGSSVMIYRKE